MKSGKRIFAVLLSVMMVACMMPSMAFAKEANEASTVAVLFTNDTHCCIEHPSKDTLGFEGLSILKEKAEKEFKNVVLVDAGDHVQGDLAGALSKGKYMVDIFNTVGYDYAAIGNHEFDFGMDSFLSDIVPAAKYQYLSANFKKANGETVFKPYEIKEYNGAKIAFLGISTPESFTKSTPAYFQDEKGNYIYNFCEGNNGQDLYDAVQSSVDAAREEGADYVVAIGHLGVDEQSAPWRSTDVIANTEGIDAFIDGHSHSTVNSEIKAKDGETVLLCQTGTKLANVGLLLIDTNKETVKSEIVSADQLAALGDVAPVKAVADKIAEITEQVKADTSKTIGKSEVLLTVKDDDNNRAVRKAETNMGNFCADAYRAIMKTDIGMVQGGGVRADINVGDVTYGDVLAVNPWNNMLCVKEVTGQTIIDALEHGARTAPTTECGGFLQVSGLTYDISIDIDSPVITDDKGMFKSIEGPRRVKNVKVGGQPIDLNKTYTVASTEYILKQDGDGFTMFKDSKDVPASTVTDADALAQYVEEHLGGTIGHRYGSVEGRIDHILTETPEVKDLKAVVIDEKAVKASWNAVEGASGYTVIYSKAGGKKIVKTTKAAEIVLRNLVAGSQYNISVTPVMEKQLLNNYVEKSSTTVVTLEKSVVNKVAKSSKGKVKVSFKNVAGESGYQISKSTKKTGTYIVSTFASKTATSKVVSAKAKTTYYYKVRAYKVIDGKKVYGQWSDVKAYKLK